MRSDKTPQKITDSNALIFNRRLFHNRPTWTNRFGWTNGPVIFVQDHVYQLSQDSVICAIKIRSFRALEITTTFCKFYPDSSLFSFTLRVTHLTNKVGRVTTFPPGFPDVRANGA